MMSNLAPPAQLTLDPQYGAVLEGRWVPAPRFVMRRHRVLRLLDDLLAGRVLEIGCGSGALLRDLAERGHECIGMETSETALEVSRQILAKSPRARIVDQAEADWDGSFDRLLAFEVLEHIEHDRDAFKQWAAWLKPGGKALVSMPAHQAMWSARDAWAGHFRRYSKQDMVKLAEAAGLKVERVECLGFPLANLTHMLGNLSMRGQKFAGGGETKQDGTDASGTERTVELKYFGMQSSWPGRMIMATACQLQRPFLNTPLGDGYLLVATKD